MDVSRKNPNVDRFIGIVSIFAGVLFFILQADGVEMNWKFSLAGYIVVAIGCVWSCLRHAVPHLGPHGRGLVALIVFAVVAVLGSIGTMKQFRREHPVQQAPIPQAGPLPVVPSPLPNPNPVPQPKTHPPHPIIITSIKPAWLPEQGKYIGVLLNMKNISGCTLATQEFHYLFLVPRSQDPTELVRLEDDHWNTLMKELDKGASIREIPTAEGGLFNSRLKINIETVEQATAIANGSLLPYFLEVIRDARTKKDLVEMCGYAGPNDTFSICSKHNRP